MSVVRFDQRQNQLWLEKFSHTLLQFISPHVKDKRILNAGCGSAWAEPLLMQAGAKSIDAFDIDPEMIAYGKKLRLRQVKFAVKDFNESSFQKNAYDLVISTEVIEHLRNYEFYLKNLATSLKKNGLLFISTPNASQSVSLSEFHIQEFKISKMKSLLKKYHLNLIKMYGMDAGKSSYLAAKYIPRPILDGIKNTFLYKILVKYFVHFPTSTQAHTVSQAATILYHCQKIK